MNHPTVQVEVAWDGSTWVDVTASCSGQIQIVRGRSRETDQYTTGTCTFTLRNESRMFDPSNTAGPYYPNVEPGAPMKISLDGVQVFGGYVDDLDVDYEMPKTCTVDVSCFDGFGLLAAAKLLNFTRGSESTGTRIASVLTALSYPGASSLDTGMTTLQGNTFNQVAGLDHIQTCSRSENGFAFIDRTGMLTFFDRYHVANETTQLTFSDLGGTDVAYKKITQKSQALLLYNQVVGTRSGGTQQEADDATSQARYQLRTLALSSLENNADSDVENLCQYLVGRYSTPDVRFDQLMIELSTFGATEREALAGLDLVQLVTVKRTPPGSGSPSMITKLEIIDGINLSLDVSASTYQMSLNLGSVDTRSFFKLDDPVFGLLDSGNKIGY